MTKDPLVESVTLAGDLPVAGQVENNCPLASEVPPSFKPYCFPASVSLQEHSQPSHPITVLRDCGALHNFVLREAVSSFPQCQLGVSLGAKGMFSQCAAEAPLCKIYLQSDVLSGFINAGIVDEIPVAGVSMILGNKTVESMVTPPSPLFNVWASRLAEVSPTCVVTRSASRHMAQDVPSELPPTNPTPKVIGEPDVPCPDFALNEFFDQVSSESYCP